MPAEAWRASKSVQYKDYFHEQAGSKIPKKAKTNLVVWLYKPAEDS
jgi:hypothetical protein